MWILCVLVVCTVSLELNNKKKKKKSNVVSNMCNLTVNFLFQAINRFKMKNTEVYWRLLIIYIIKLP